ncbi:MAG: hypothetical protein D6754_02355 [Alphaproteobacteria bacterium]|nr:MAG: hypothetical protein D6754_02355 [Alphaproteobacteria bacterium]
MAVEGALPEAKLKAGARNLLCRCAGLRAGDRVTILHEPPDAGYYDPGLPAVLARVAGELGIEARLREVPVVADAGAIAARPGDLTGGGNAIFLARIGDQLRFAPESGRGRVSVCYALDRRMLASGFGTADYAAFLAIRDRVQALLSQAGHIHVTCPAGTDFAGAAPGFDAGPDVTIRRFPMPTITPIPAGGFSGRVALPGFLTGTGSRFYEPYSVTFEGRVLAEFEGRRLIGFFGSASDVRRAEAQYDRVAALFGIERDLVHSWHPGIHPGCAYGRPAAEDLMRWGGAAFGNPRLLHFHTCGDYAPGEISWNVVDATIRVDGVAVWEAGRLIIDRVPGSREILDEHPCARAAFAQPALEIGL